MSWSGPAPARDVRLHAEVVALASPEPGRRRLWPASMAPPAWHLPFPDQLLRHTAAEEDADWEQAKAGRRSTWLGSCIAMACKLKSCLQLERWFGRPPSG